MKKTLSKHGILFLIVLVLISIGVFVYGIYSTNTYISEAETLLVQVKNLEDKNGTLYGGRSSLKNSAVLIDALNKSIANENDVVLFEKIERFAKSSGVSLVVQSIVTDPIENKKLHALKLRLAFNGSWKSVVAFAYGIERFPFILSAQGISLVATNTTDKKTGEWNGILDVMLPVVE